MLWSYCLTFSLYYNLLVSGAFGGVVLSFGYDQLGVGGLLLSRLCFIPSFALLAIAESLVGAISPRLECVSANVAIPRYSALLIGAIFATLERRDPLRQLNPHDSHIATLYLLPDETKEAHANHGGHKQESEHCIHRSIRRHKHHKKIPRRRSQKIAVAH